MQDIKEKIKALAAQNLREVISIRRHLHSHPELSFQEFNTAKFVSEKLKEYDIPHETGIAGTGIVALLKGTQCSPKVGGRKDVCIALRADMDALPIIEANEVEYKSQNVGVMHACGHDVHTSSLLGAAKILSELTNEFEGTIKFIFQPGEEKLPGGASLMIRDGALENPKPASIIGQHVMPSIDAGKVGFRSGLYMASTDEIYLTVKGKGGHAAIPKNYNNPLLIASQILLSLQAVFMDEKTRNIPGIPTVIAFGKITGNGATNVIPDNVFLEGTFRTMNEEWRTEAHLLIKQIAQSKAESMGGSCDVNIMKGYPFLVNDEVVTANARQYAEEYLGKENIIELDKWMASEDFAFYSQELPACFYRLGVRNEQKGIISAVHTPTFNVDESSLEIGMGLMAWLTINLLRRKKSEG